MTNETLVERLRGGLEYDETSEGSEVCENSANTLMNEAADEIQRLTAELAACREAAKPLYVALTEACDYRRGLCGNSDADNEGGKPDTWDKPLMRWTEALAQYDRSGT